LVEKLCRRVNEVLADSCIYFTFCLSYIYIYTWVDPKFCGLVRPSAQEGTVYKEFVPTGQTVNSGFYYKVLRRLREKVRRHRPQLWREQTWLLYRDNAPSHTAVLTHQFLANNKIVLIPHQP